MSKKCLFCYEDLIGEEDFHEKCSLRFFGTKTAPKLPYGLNMMQDLAKEVVVRSIAVPGVQPKILMSVIKEAREKGDGRLTVVGALGGNYILKPPSEDYPEMPQNEHLTMRIAEEYGINVVPSSLIRLKSGELAYITKRIDRRKNGEKIHMLDMFQILEAYDKYKGSMEKTGIALGEYSSNTLLDKILFFELTLFSFVVGNNDMHLKNFSMIQKENAWILSPAYDLLNIFLLLPQDSEELALPINGKKKKLNRNLFVEFGFKLGLSSKQIEAAFKRLKGNRPKAQKFIENSFLSTEMKTGYLSLMKLRYSRL
jgi:serine/threonine-protein kinase HipA